MQKVVNFFKENDIILLAVPKAAFFLDDNADMKTVMLDEGDTAFRAARANFGLIWFQGKGLGSRRYTGKIQD